VIWASRERSSTAPDGHESPLAAIGVGRFPDRPGDAEEKAESEAIAQARERIGAEGPSEAEGRHGVVLHERRKAGDGDEGQAEILGYAAGLVGFVDQQGFDASRFDCGRAVAQDHVHVVAYALDGEAEGLERAQAAQLVVKLAESAKGIVFGADLAELNAGGADAGLGVGDAEENDAVSALDETAGERGEGVEVAGAGEGERSDDRHGNLRAMSDGASWPQQRYASARELDVRMVLLLPRCRSIKNLFISRGYISGNGGVHLRLDLRK
jgi:hypothetical protein